MIKESQEKLQNVENINETEEEVIMTLCSATANTSLVFSFSYLLHIPFIDYKCSDLVSTFHNFLFTSMIVSLHFYDYEL